MDFPFRGTSFYSLKSIFMNIESLSQAISLSGYIEMSIYEIIREMALSRQGYIEMFYKILKNILELHIQSAESVLQSPLDLVNLIGIFLVKSSII